MKILFLLAFFISLTAVASTTGVKGVVRSQKECSTGPVMVWLSLDKDNYNERLLLMHTEVPVGGSFQFYLKPGAYQLRASDQSGCESLQKIKVSGSLLEATVSLVKK